MTGKMVTTYNTADTTFKRIMSEIRIENIPPKYISRITITYPNGTCGTVERYEITTAVNVLGDDKFVKSKSTGRFDSYVVSIDVETLERDVTAAMQDLFGDFFDGSHDIG